MCRRCRSLNWSTAFRPCLTLKSLTCRIRSSRDVNDQPLRWYNRDMSDPDKKKCADCGEMRTPGQACEHCGVCPECGSTDDEPPTFDCGVCGRKGTDDAIDWGGEIEDGEVP